MDSIEAIIFDADGMIILGERPSVRLSAQFNIPMEKISPFFEHEFQKCLIGEADLKEVVAPYLKIWGWEKGVEAFLDFWFRESYHTDPEMVASIRVLRDRGLKCLLATNQEEYRVHFMKTEMGFSKLFDDIFPSYELGVKKSSPTFLTVMADSFPDFPRDHFLFWDDRIENVAAAKHFGFTARQYVGIEDFKRTLGLPDFIPPLPSSGPGQIRY